MKTFCHDYFPGQKSANCFGGGQVLPYRMIPRTKRKQFSTTLLFFQYQPQKNKIIKLKTFFEIYLKKEECLNWRPFWFRVINLGTRVICQIFLTNRKIAHSRITIIQPLFQSVPFSFLHGSTHLFFIPCKASKILWKKHVKIQQTYLSRFEPTSFWLA